MGTFLRSLFGKIGNVKRQSSYDTPEVQLKEFKRDGKELQPLDKPLPLVVNQHPLNTKEGLKPSETSEQLKASTLTASLPSLPRLGDPVCDFVLHLLTESSAVPFTSSQDILASLCVGGVQLCKLLSSKIPGSLDERAVNNFGTDPQPAAQPYIPHGNKITDQDVVENYQLLLSCAQVQGCDVQGLTVERLQDGEGAALITIALEILRVAAVQAFDPQDRAWLSQSVAAEAALSRGGSSGGGEASSVDSPPVSPAVGARRHLSLTPGAVSTGGARWQPDWRGQCKGPAEGGQAEGRSPLPCARLLGEQECRGLDGELRWRLQRRRQMEAEAGSQCAMAPVPEGRQAPAAAATTASAVHMPGGPAQGALTDAHCSEAHPCTPTKEQLSASISASASGQAAMTAMVAAGADGIGTAAARRAAVGLERWALQLAIGEVGTEHGAVGNDGASIATDGTGGPGILPPTLSLPNDLRSQSTSLAAASLDMGHHGGLAGPHLGRTTSAPAARFPPVRMVAEPPTAIAHGGSQRASPSSPIGPDALDLPAWEALAKRLLQGPGSMPGGKVDPDPLSAPAAQAPCQSSLVPGTAASLSSASGDPDSAEDARWEAVAVSLSELLAAHNPVRLPPLQPEHLTCPHPGLRSALLAHLLLAHRRAQRLSAAGPAHTDKTSGLQPTQPDCRMSGSTSGSSCSTIDGGMEAAAAAAAAVAIQPPPASPAPPAPPPTQHVWPGVTLRSSSRKAASAGGGHDVLSEHNLLIAKEHRERQLRRQLRAQAGQTPSGGGADIAPAASPTVGGGCTGRAWGGGEDELSLWQGEEGDVLADTQEERVLRLWLNSLDPAIHLGSLFEPHLATGWPLLLALEAIQPGCVPWSITHRPPFKEKLRKLLSVQNCNIVIDCCARQLAMPPLVNIGGLDIALGQRRATLSLVFQLMRHHTAMLLGLTQPSAGPHASHHPDGGAPTPPPQQHPFHHYHSPHPRGSRPYVEVEKAVLAWANAKLAEAAAGGRDAAATAPFAPLSSFSDPRLGEGEVLLRLLAAISPRAVDTKHILPGATRHERESNAKYVLSCARKMGCVIFLVWEDVMAARPNLMLLLLASFMARDKQRISVGTATGATIAGTALAGAATPAAGTGAAVVLRSTGLRADILVEPRRSTETQDREVRSRQRRPS